MRTLRYQDEKLCLHMTHPDIDPEGAKAVGGGRWNPRHSRWEYPFTLTSFERITTTLHPHVSDKLQAWAERRRREREEQALMATATDLPPETFAWDAAPRLYPFQRTGVRFLADAGRGITGDDMGLGKTVQCIGAIKENELRNGLAEASYLVVCPATIKDNWRREINTKWGLPDKVFVVNGTALQREKTFREFTRHIGIKWLIINWESLRSYYSFKKPGLDQLTQWNTSPTRVDPFWESTQWDAIVVDEAHRAKDRKARQTRALFHLRNKTDQMYLATGTPILNAPQELWSLLALARPDDYTSFWNFVDRYIRVEETRFGRKLLGEKPETRAELQAELASIMIRRTKAEVLTELPPKTYQDVLVQLEGQQLAAYNQMRDDMLAWLEEQEEEIAAPTVLAQLIRLKQIAGSLDLFEENPRLITGKHSAKLDALMDVVTGTDQKVIIFSNFKRMLTAAEKRLHKEGIKTVRIDGDVAQSERQGIVDAFQRREGIQVFLGTIGAAGVGLTLTAASLVCFLDLDWTPAMNVQAEDRAHRIGQESNVHVIRFLAENTVDVHAIVPTLTYKKDMIARIIGV